jgi:protein TonB
VLIVGVHAAAIVAVMTAKMDLPARIKTPPTIIDFWPEPVPPPPEPVPQPPTSKTETPKSTIDHTKPIVTTPTHDDGPTIDTTAIPPDFGTVAGSGTDAAPPYVPPPPMPVVVPARFATPDWLVKPPYPDDKRRLEEEASLKLRLTIDERGRVVAVDPVGRVDPSFLASARKHLIAHWKYKPATEDGRPVVSTTVVTLRFQLDG